MTPPAATAATTALASVPVTIATNAEQTPQWKRHTGTAPRGNIYKIETERSKKRVFWHYFTVDGSGIWKVCAARRVWQGGWCCISSSDKVIKGLALASCCAVRSFRFFFLFSFRWLDAVVAFRTCRSRIDIQITKCVRQDVRVLTPWCKANKPRINETSIDYTMEWRVAESASDYDWIRRWPSETKSMKVPWSGAPLAKAPPQRIFSTFDFHIGMHLLVVNEEEFRALEISIQILNECSDLVSALDSPVYFPFSLIHFESECLAATQNRKSFLHKAQVSNFIDKL